MRKIPFLLLVFSLGLCSFNLLAAQLTPLSVEDLSRRADLILQGTVTSKTCLRDPDGRIVTHVQLTVSNVWKGTLATNSFTIVHSGGTIGDIESEVTGQVEYSVGEEVVAFLVLNKRGEGVTIGLAQGKFLVWKDKTTGEKFVHNIFHGDTEEAAARSGNKAAKLALKELQQRAQGAAR
jgi:hypothetical protein